MENTDAELEDDTAAESKHEAGEETEDELEHKRVAAES